MIKDFRDTNNNIILMRRGTDSSYTFKPLLDNGSTFVWNQWLVTCEGRLSSATEKVDIWFPVFEVEEDFDLYIKIGFPKDLVSTDIRENKIYYRVLATRDVDDGETIVLNYGEIWIKT